VSLQGEVAGSASELVAPLPPPATLLWHAEATASVLRGLGWYATGGYMSMGGGGVYSISGPLRFVSLFANIFCVRDFLSSFFSLLLLYCLVVRPFNRSSVKDVRLFGWLGCSGEVYVYCVF